MTDRKQALLKAVAEHLRAQLQHQVPSDWQTLPCGTRVLAQVADDGSVKITVRPVGYVEHVSVDIGFAGDSTSGPTNADARE
jgi:hypothetical protein